MHAQWSQELWAASLTFTYLQSATVQILGEIRYTYILMEYMSVRLIVRLSLSSSGL